MSLDDTYAQLPPPQLSTTHLPPNSFYHPDYGSVRIESSMLMLTAVAMFTVAGLLPCCWAVDITYESIFTIFCINATNIECNINVTDRMIPFDVKLSMSVYFPRNEKNYFVWIFNILCHAVLFSVKCGSANHCILFSLYFLQLPGAFQFGLCGYSITFIISVRHRAENEGDVHQCSKKQLFLMIACSVQTISVPSKY